MTDVNDKTPIYEFDKVNYQMRDWIGDFGPLFNADLVKIENAISGSVQGTSWGSITGTLSNQTDLVAELNKRVEKTIVGANGTATIFNESDGGGSMFTHIDGTTSFVGVNEGGATGITMQIYSKNSSTNLGTRINVTNAGAYYNKNTTSAVIEADAEIATIADVKNLDRFYPVNSVYISIVDTNPSTLFGGTWETVPDVSLTGLYLFKRTA